MSYEPGFRSQRVRETAGYGPGRTTFEQRQNRADAGVGGTLRTGGFTASTQGQPTPKTGFMVSRQGHEQSFPEMVTPSNIREYEAQNAGHLQEPGTFMGGWKDTAKGRTTMDVSEHYRTEDAAQQAITREHQDAGFNLKTGQDLLPNLNHKQFAPAHQVSNPPEAFPSPRV